MSELRGGIGWRMVGEEISIISCVDWEGINGALKFLRLCSFFLPRPPDPCSHSSLPCLSSSPLTPHSIFMICTTPTWSTLRGPFIIRISTLSDTSTIELKWEWKRKKSWLQGGYGLGVGWHGIFTFPFFLLSPHTQRHSTSHSLQQMKSYNNM